MTVYVTFSITPTAAAPTLTTFYISLPIASNLAAGYDLTGCGTRYRTGGSAMEAVYIESDTAGDRAYCYFTAASTSAFDTSMTFSYVVL